LTAVSEKSPLPAIIVTPSSPACSGDFSIAFLAPPPRPSLRARLKSLTAPLQFKARTTFILLLLLFILTCHLLTHRLAARNPHLDFSAMRDIGLADPEPPAFGGWFNWQVLWGIVVPDSKREFVITEAVES